MSQLLILTLMAFGQIATLLIVFALITIGERALLAWRLWRDRGLSYPWSRAWRKAGFHLQH